MSLVLATIFLFILKERRNKKIKPQQTINGKIIILPTVAGILQPAHIFSGADDKTFYNILRNCIWNFFTVHFGLTGSHINKLSLSKVLQQNRIAEKDKTAILEILEQCETGIFTNVETAGDKKKLLEETKDVLENIRKQSGIQFVAR